VQQGGQILHLVSLKGRLPLEYILYNWNLWAPPWATEPQQNPIFQGMNARTENRGRMIERPGAREPCATETVSQRSKRRLGVDYVCPSHVFGK